MDELMKQAEDHLAKGRVQIATDEAIHVINHIAADQSGVDERDALRRKVMAALMQMGHAIDEKKVVLYASKSDQNALGEMVDIFVDATLPSNAAQSAGQEPFISHGFEHVNAVSEGHRNHDVDAYFKARPNSDSDLARRMFEEGHKRGFDAAQKRVAEFFANRGEKQNG